MRLLVTGLNHRTAPVEVRERVAFAEGALPEALRNLKGRNGLLEGMILSTCNRVEIAVTSDEQSDPNPTVNAFLTEAHNLEQHALAQYFYRYEGRDAIRHIFRVAASLDSMVVGEPQILGQLKGAYAAAKTAGAMNGFLELVLTRAFSVAKRVRSETEIGQNAVSVSYAAVELAREIFGSLENRKVLLVGAGKMTELAARHLRRSGASNIFVTNRTRARADSMARLFDGKVVEYDQLQQTLPEMDIVITSSAAPHYIISREDMKRAIDIRRNRPMFLIDIAVPRNIEPSVNQVDNVFLYDIDDLEKVIQSNRKGRLKEAAQAEEIIAEEVERLVLRLKTREAAPTIVVLQDRLEQIRQSEVQRLRGKLGVLSQQQEEAIEALTRGIMNKIAHGPIAELRKQAGNPDGLSTVDVIRKVFRLEDD